MMFCRGEKPWIFLHIPRTSGVALYATLGILPGVVVTEQRHLTARYAPTTLGEALWCRAFRFAFIRNPWNIVESDYRMTRQQACEGLHRSLQASDLWQQRLQRMRQNDTFERFVREEILGEYSGLKPGGYWKTWCCDEDGQEMGVEGFRYEDLPRLWPELLARLGLPTDLPRLKLNTSPHYPVQWTDDLRREVGELCRYDLEKFGY